MLRTLANVFRLYTATHMSVFGNKQELVDREARTIGYVDEVRLRNGQLRVTGWTTASRVTLCSAHNKTACAPDIVRPDVSRALKFENASRKTGFELAISHSDNPVFLTLEQESETISVQLAPFPTTAVRRAKLQNGAQFAADLISATPLIANWLIIRSPVVRRRILKRLDLWFEDHRPFFDNSIFDKATSATPPAPPITIILPVYNAFDLLRQCLGRLVKHSGPAWHLILIEDCSSDGRVRPWVRKFAERHGAQVTLIENDKNLGFVTSVNRGLEIALVRGDHVVLLNSDALVPADWLSRLLAPITVHRRIASATPFSNDAEICNVPQISVRSTLLPGHADELDRVAATLTGAAPAEAPTGVGFCMAINIVALRTVPQFDTIFGRGYGEEVDWCQQVRRHGFSHAIVPNLFVEHRGGASFGSGNKLSQLQHSGKIISRRYPRYATEVQQFAHNDPLASARFALAIALVDLQVPDRPLQLFLAHSLGGGAEIWLRGRIEDEMKSTGGALVLRVGSSVRWQLEVHSRLGVSAMPVTDLTAMQQLLAPVRALNLVYSCGVGDPDPITLPQVMLDLKRRDRDRIDVLFHDFFPISPSYTLLDSNGAYRGPPDPLNRDKAHQTSRPDGAPVSLTTWRHEWSKLILVAESLLVFSRSSAEIVSSVWPERKSRILVTPHRLHTHIPIVARKGKSGREVIAILGNIGLQKGAQIVAKLARSLDQPNRADVVVIGNLNRSYATNHSLRIHGDYQPGEIPTLLAHYGATRILIPSIWPETFSYTTREALATGLPVYCFDLGAQAEVVRAHPNGYVLERSLITENGNAIATAILEHRAVAA